MPEDDRGAASGANDRAAQEREELRHRSGMDGEASRGQARSEGLAPRNTGPDDPMEGRGGTGTAPANPGMGRTEGNGSRAPGGRGPDAGTEGRPKARRGFAAMDPEKQREIARKGGRASGGRPENLRGVDRQAAGRKGGQAVVTKYGPQHMAEIGRKGGRSSGGFSRDAGRTGGLPAAPSDADAEGQGTEAEADRAKRLDRFGNTGSEGEAAAGST